MSTDLNTRILEICTHFVEANYSRPIKVYTRLTQLLSPIFTTHKRSCENVMFSQTSVCSQGGRKHQMHHGIDMGTYPPPTPDIRPGDLIPPSPHLEIRPGDHLVMIAGDLFKLVHLGTYPPIQSDIWWWQLKLKQVRWAVCMLLECCLVYKPFSDFSFCIMTRTYPPIYMQ